MAKVPVIDDWEIGHFFGETVIRGCVDGHWLIVPFRWWSAGRFGVAWSSLGTEAVFAVGRRSPDAFAHLAKIPA